MAPTNDKFIALMENLPDAFAYCQLVNDKDGVPEDYILLKVNNAFEKMTGLTRDLITGKRVTEVYPEILEEGYDWIDAFGKIALGGESISFDYFSKPLKSWYQIIAYSDEPGYFAVIFRDITEQKKAKRVFRENIVRYSALLHAIPDLVFICSRQGIYLDFHVPQKDMLLFQWEEFLGRSIGEVFSEVLTEEFLYYFEKAYQDKETQVMEYSLDLKEGLKYFEARITCMDEERLLIIVRDITRRKEAEVSLKETLNRLNALLENSPTLIAIFDEEGKYIEVSKSIARVIGLLPEEVKGKTFADLLPSDVAGEFNKIINKLKKGQEVITKKDVFLVEGKERIFKTWLFPVKIENSDHNLFGSIAIDITQGQRLEERLKYMLKFEKMVFDISSYFVSLPSEELDQGIDYALKLVGKFFQVDRSCVFQFAPDREEVHNTHEWCREGIEGRRGRMQRILQNKLPWWSQGVKRRDSVYIPPVDSGYPGIETGKREPSFQTIHSLLCTPFFKKGKIFGFMALDGTREKRVWTEDQVSLLKIVAELISNALIRYQAGEKIRHLSLHDQLTGLYNRFYLEAEMERLDTERQLPISVIMADLNGLKLVNDTYGHGTGDEMLIKAVTIIKESCRAEDIVARWGGDEFVILLPQTAREIAWSVCKRINNGCGNTYVGDVPISIALGVASKDSVDKMLTEVLKEAEDDMYKNKLAESRSKKSGLVNTLLKALAEKSFETEAHTRRMGAAAFNIGKRVGLSSSELIRQALLINLHDIGKINIPEEVLTKKESLTEDEWEIMKKHPETGYRIARATEEFVHVADDILAHHEHWDGRGYPYGLKGKEISLLARITAIADAFEVMTYGRPYKQPLTREEALAELKRCSGTQFDPELVEIFISLLEEEDREGEEKVGEDNQGDGSPGLST